MSKKAGIYKIHNKVNGKNYVGGSINIKKRIINHRSQLKNNRHDNDYLQKAYNKYGGENFEFVILEYCDPKYLVEREQFWIDKLRVIDNEFGYNICPTAGSFLGHKHTEETRRKMSITHKAIGISPENLRKLHENRTYKKGKDHPSYGKKRPKYVGRKISEAKKEWYKKNKSPFAGKKHTPETKKKMSKAQSGKNNPMYGIKRFGKDNPMYGKKRSKETRKKSSKALRKQWRQKHKEEIKMSEENAYCVLCMLKYGILNPLEYSKEKDEFLCVECSSDDGIFIHRTEKLFANVRSNIRKVQKEIKDIKKLENEING